MSLITLKKVFDDHAERNMMPRALFEEMFKDVSINLVDDEPFYDPVYVSFDNFDERHDNSMQQPIYLNDFDFNIQEDRDTIISLLRTEYEQNNFSTIGSCTCGKYKANMYVNTDFVCDECFSPVIKPLSGNFVTRVWLRAPAKVEGFINPAVYDAFLKKLNTKTPKVNIADYWINPTIRNERRFRDKRNPAFKIATKLNEFRLSLGIEFGYNDFIKHIDKIITNLLSNDYLKLLDLRTDERMYYLKFWERYKGVTTSKYFPVPNKIMTIVETDNRNKYYTREQMEVNRLFQTIADLYEDDDPFSEQNADIMGKHFELLVSALSKVRNNVLFGKKGAIRYSAGSARLPFTGRTIISGESGVCRSDTVILPWHYALTCLDKHLTNWLYRRGYAPLQVRKVIRNAANKICPIVEEFVNWVEDNRYAIVIVGRNPSIQYLSARAMFAKFNRDPNDLSMRIPITSTRTYNADFDGILPVAI